MAELGLIVVEEKHAVAFREQEPGRASSNASRGACYQKVSAHREMA